MGGKPIQPRIMQYIERHPGVTLVPHDIAANLDETAQRVQSAINHLIARGQFEGLTRVTRGIYMYRPPSAEQLAAKEASENKPTGPILYELVGRTESIGDLVRDEHGFLYKIERL